MTRLNVLVLCDDNRAHANTVRDHIEGLTRHSRHRVRLFNPRGLSESRLLDFDEFDVLVVHWSLVIISDHYLAPDFRSKLAAFKGVKVQFLQDDYRWVDKISAMMRFFGIAVLFTLVPPGAASAVWTRRLPGVRIEPTLAGYVPERLVGLDAPPLEGRPVDIGYRGRILPFHLGEVSQEKVWIGEGVLARAPAYGLRCDIGWKETDRIYGAQWDRFIRSCRTMLGTESGATIFDFDGSAEENVRTYLANHPGADFFEVQRQVLGPYENNVRITVVSPRVFEAIAWRTALIQFPGDYSGVVSPWRHYIPLMRDFSNFGEVVDSVRDTESMRAMTERAYEDVIASGRYSMRAFVARFDQILDEEFSRHEVHRSRATIRQRRRVLVPFRYWLARVEVVVVSPLAYASRKLGEARSRRLAAAVKGLVAILLIARTKELRRIVGYWIRHPLGLPGSGVGSLLRDLLKIGIVRNAHRGTGDRFAVTFRVDGDRLIITSQRLDFPVAGDLGWSTVETALRIGEIRRISWDHSAVGFSAWYPLPFGRRLAVGSEGGRNELAALDSFLIKCPILVVDALRPSLLAELTQSQGRPARSTH
jgi:hypothetical protein